MTARRRQARWPIVTDVAGDESTRSAIRTWMPSASARPSHRDWIPSRSATVPPSARCGVRSRLDWSQQRCVGSHCRPSALRDATSQRPHPGELRDELLHRHPGVRPHGAPFWASGSTCTSCPAGSAGGSGTGSRCAPTSPGRRTRSLDVTHSYLTKGRVAPSVDTTYTARYRVNGGPVARRAGLGDDRRARRSTSRCSRPRRPRGLPARLGSRRGRPAVEHLHRGRQPRRAADAGGRVRAGRPGLHRPAVQHRQRVRLPRRHPRRGRRQPAPGVGGDDAAAARGGPRAAGRARARSS